MRTEEEIKERLDAYNTINESDEFEFYDVLLPSERHEMNVLEWVLGNISKEQLKELT